MLLRVQNANGTVNGSVVVNHVLTGNVVGEPLDGLVPGELYIYSITQDSVGGWSYTFPSNVKGASSPSTTANTTSVQCFTTVDGATLVPIGASTMTLNS